jgi:predicted ribosome quality control (RQC) complex YloA/Tae2 family protein
MKTQLSSFELKYMLDELKILIDSKVDSILNPEKHELLIQFFVSGKGKKVLRILPTFIYLSSQKKSQEKASGFCMSLRKNLINSRLRDIKQIDSERVLKILFETKEQKFILIVELFSKGNVILCKEDYSIVSVLESQQWKDRELKSRIKYEFPPPRMNFFKLDSDKLKELFNSDKPLVKKLASDLGFGGVYAEEICLLSGLDKEKVKLTNDNIKRIIETINKLVKKKIKPCIVYKDEKIKDITPFHLKTYVENKIDEFEDYNSAIDSVLAKGIQEEFKDEKTSVYEKKAAKINKIIKIQQKKILNINEDIKGIEKKAELIYSNYDTVGDIIKTINDAVKKYSWEEIKEKLKDHKVVSEVNSKDKKVVLELE